jgi:non-homologous end joining protein Ku
MLEAKVAGQEIAKPEPVPETPVIDLMAALKASVAETKKQPARKAAASSGPKRRRAPARKAG